MKDRIHFIHILSLLIAGSFLISVIAPVSALADACRQAGICGMLAAPGVADTYLGHEFAEYHPEMEDSAWAARGIVSPSRTDRDALLQELRSGQGNQPGFFPDSGTNRHIPDATPVTSRSIIIDKLVRNNQGSGGAVDPPSSVLLSSPGLGKKLNGTVPFKNRSTIPSELVLNKKGVNTLPSRFSSGEGTVRFIDLEGGFYGIVTSSGQRFIPDNLPGALLADGITIRFTAVIGNEEPGITMWGRSIHLLSSEKIDRTFFREGTIWYIDLEGGFYGIITPTGGKYLPLYLAPEFRIDGLPVEFTARERLDFRTTAMWGVPLDIISIQAVGEPGRSVVGPWKLIGFHDGSVWRAPLPGNEVTAVFSDDGTLSGSAGCNRYFATYATNATALNIGPVGSTEMYCAGRMDQEIAYLRLLATASSFRVGEGVLTLFDQSSREILTYQAENAESGEDEPARVEFSRTGGFAGYSDRLILFEDGSAHVTRKDYTARIQVNDEVLDLLQRYLAPVDFGTLRDEYDAPQGGADFFSYTLTCEGRTIHLEETAVPESLLPVIDLFCEIIVTSAPDDIAPPLPP